MTINDETTIGDLAAELESNNLCIAAVHHHNDLWHCVVGRTDRVLSAVGKSDALGQAIQDAIWAIEEHINKEDNDA